MIARQPNPWTLATLLPHRRDIHTDSFVSANTQASRMPIYRCLLPTYWTIWLLAGTSGIMRCAFVAQNMSVSLPLNTGLSATPTSEQCAQQRTTPRPRSGLRQEAALTASRRVRRSQRWLKFTNRTGTACWSEQAGQPGSVEELSEERRVRGRSAEQIRQGASGRRRRLDVGHVASDRARVEQVTECNGQVVVAEFGRTRCCRRRRRQQGCSRRPRRWRSCRCRRSGRCCADPG